MAQQMGNWGSFTPKSGVTWAELPGDFGPTLYGSSMGGWVRPTGHWGDWNFRRNACVNFPGRFSRLFTGGDFFLKNIPLDP